MAEHCVIIPGPCEWMSTNHRDYWPVRAARTKQWRWAAFAYARQAKIPAITVPVEIMAVVHRTDRRRSDAHNRLPTIKATIDGIVDAGVLPDDNDKVVVELRIRPGEPVDRRSTPYGQLDLLIRELGAADR